MSNITIVNGYIVAGGTKRDVITGFLGEDVVQMEVMQVDACSVSEEEVLFKVKNYGAYDVALHEASYENMMELIMYFVKEHNMGARWDKGDGYYYVCLFHEWDSMESSFREEYNEDDSYNPCYDDLEHMRDNEGPIDFGITTADDFPLEEEDLPF